MVASCANPLCKAKFRYLHDGKLFFLQLGIVAGSDAEWTTATRPAQYFWLCSTCCRSFRLALHPVSGVTLISIATTKAALDSSSADMNGGQRGTTEAA